MKISETLFGVVDVETTSADPETAGVVEAAIVPASLGGGVVPIRSGGWVDFFDPGIPIPAEAKAVHHITEEDVHGACHFNDVSEFDFSFEAFAAHNAEFERRVVNQFKGRPVVCTYRLARKLWPELDHFGNQFLRYHLGLDVPEEIRALGVHRAYPDAFVTASILLRELVELGRKFPEIETVEDLVAWLDEPILLNRIRFGKYGPKDGKPGKLWAELPKEYLRWLVDKATDLEVDERFTALHYLTKGEGHAQESSGDRNS